MKREVAKKWTSGMAKLQTGKKEKRRGDEQVEQKNYKQVIFSCLSLQTYRENKIVKKYKEKRVGVEPQIQDDSREMMTQEEASSLLLVMFPK